MEDIFNENILSTIEATELNARSPISSGTIVRILKTIEPLNAWRHYIVRVEY